MRSRGAAPRRVQACGGGRAARWSGSSEARPACPSLGGAALAPPHSPGSQRATKQEPNSGPSEGDHALTPFGRMPAYTHPVWGWEASRRKVRYRATPPGPLWSMASPIWNSE